MLDGGLVASALTETSRAGVGPQGHGLGSAAGEAEGLGGLGHRSGRGEVAGGGGRGAEAGVDGLLDAVVDVREGEPVQRGSSLLLPQVGDPVARLRPRWRSASQLHACSSFLLSRDRRC